MNGAVNPQGHQLGSVGHSQARMRHGMSSNDSSQNCYGSTSASADSDRNAAFLAAAPHPLTESWTFWYLHRSNSQRFRAHKHRDQHNGDGFEGVLPQSGPAPVNDSEYEKQVQKVGTFASLEDFWAIYSHLKRANQLDAGSDIHLFRNAIRPVWEDEANANGGKWILRFRKGLAARLWEELVFMIIADQVDMPSDEICGLVLSVRHNEDVISVWNKTCDRSRAKGVGNHNNDGGEMSLKVK